MRYRDLRIRVHLERVRLRLTAAPGPGDPVRVAVDDVDDLLGAGESLEFAIRMPGQGERDGAQPPATWNWGRPRAEAGPPRVP